MKHDSMHHSLITYQCVISLWCTPLVASVSSSVLFLYFNLSQRVQFDKFCMELDCKFGRFVLSLIRFRAKQISNTSKIKQFNNQFFNHSSNSNDDVYHCARLTFLVNISIFEGWAMVWVLTLVVI